MADTRTMGSRTRSQRCELRARSPWLEPAPTRPGWHSGDPCRAILAPTKTHWKIRPHLILRGSCYLLVGIHHCDKRFHSARVDLSRIVRSGGCHHLRGNIGFCHLSRGLCRSIMTSTTVEWEARKGSSVFSDILDNGWPFLRG